MDSLIKLPFEQCFLIAPGFNRGRKSVFVGFSRIFVVTEIKIGRNIRLKPPDGAILSLSRLKSGAIKTACYNGALFFKLHNDTHPVYFGWWLPILCLFEFPDIKDLVERRNLFYPYLPRHCNQLPPVIGRMIDTMMNHIVSNIAGFPGVSGLKI